MTNDRNELAELLKSALGDRATELLMNELPDDTGDDDVDPEITGLSAHMDQQFAWVRDQFESVNHRFAEVDQRLDDLGQAVHRTETSVLVLSERIETNHAKVEALVLREIGAVRGEIVAQTRQLLIGIPSMTAAVALLVLAFVQFAIVG
jgi:chromosome segregation ATPase